MCLDRRRTEVSILSSETNQLSSNEEFLMRCGNNKCTNTFNPYKQTVYKGGTCSSKCAHDVTRRTEEYRIKSRLYTREYRKIKPKLKSGRYD